MERRINYIAPRVNTNDRSVGLSPLSGEKRSSEGGIFFNMTSLFRGRWHSEGMTERASYVVHIGEFADEEPSAFQDPYSSIEAALSGGFAASSP